MKSLRVFLFVCVLFTFSSFAKADICEDINDLSNIWNDIANFLHEYEEDGFNNEEANEIDKLVNAATQPTQQLAAALIAIGNQTEVALGERLNHFVVELKSRQRGDLVAYLVDVMDDITDSLDAIVDYCDQQE